MDDRHGGDANSYARAMFEGGGSTTCVARVASGRAAWPTGGPPWPHREVEDSRLRVHADVIANWGILQSSGPAITSAEAAVKANKIALTGVREEEKVGQRTTLDVLNSQQDLILAKARLIGAQRDRVIASYTLLAAIGRLDVKTLNLNTPDYLPEVHYHQVRDAWHGLRTPSGQ